MALKGVGRQKPVSFRYDAHTELSFRISNTGDPFPGFRHMQEHDAVSLIIILLGERAAFVCFGAAHFGAESSWVFGHGRSAKAGAR